MIIDKKKLALIHIAKKELGLNEAQYRSILQKVCNISSAKNLEDEAQFYRLMQYFETLGYKRKIEQNYPITRSSQWNKCLALWKDLYHAGKVQTPSEEALIKFGSRYRALKRGPGLIRLIEILKQWLKREEKYYE